MNSNHNCCSEEELRAGKGAKVLSYDSDVETYAVELDDGTEQDQLIFHKTKVMKEGLTGQKLHC